MNQISIHASRETVEEMERQLRRAGKGLARMDQRLVRFAREKPVAAAFAALTAGFLLGRLLSRR